MPSVADAVVSDHGILTVTTGGRMGALHPLENFVAPLEKRVRSWRGVWGPVKTRAPKDRVCLSSHKRNWRAKNFMNFWKWRRFKDVQVIWWTTTPLRICGCNNF